MTRTCSARRNRHLVRSCGCSISCTRCCASFGYAYTIELSTQPDEGAWRAATLGVAERMLASVLDERRQAYTIDAGGGAFYGPKLDFKLVDAIGRKWQGPTVQLDFNLPERFELDLHRAPTTRAHRPVMLHRVLARIDGAVRRRPHRALRRRVSALARA